MPSTLAAKLKKLATSDKTHFAWDSGDDCIIVNSPHALTRAMGYLKYLAAKDDKGCVYFRGQTRLYPSLRATLYRSTNKRLISHPLKTNRENDLKKLLSGAISVFENNTPECAREPLLQHYGISTRWVDLVDNLWVALWFASNSSHAHERYFHFAPSSTEWAYLLAICPGPVEAEEEPGYWKTAQSEVIDLRQAAPSTYIRPHAQHGLLVRRRKCATVADTDLSPWVVGRVKVAVAKALRWLGEGELLSPHHLFPPPNFDHGYRILLENMKDKHPRLGAISIITA